MKPATATAIEMPPPLGPSWWQRLGARIFGLPLAPAAALTGPRLASGMVNGRYPPLEIFAVRDHYSGRLYCLRPPEDFTRGCGPILRAAGRDRRGHRQAAGRSGAARGAGGRRLDHGHLGLVGQADAVHAVLGACPDGDRLTDDYAALRDGSIKAWTPPEE